LRTSVDSLEWLACRLATLGWDFEVESPLELLELLRQAGERISRATRLPAGG
jgi:hypothetical protein